MANPEQHNRGQFPPSRESQQETRADLPVVRDEPKPPRPPLVPGGGSHYDQPAFQWTPPPSYPSLPPPPSPQLPDFKPRGMSAIDKALAWLMAFIVLVFGLIIAAHYLLMPATVKTPAPKPTSSSATHHAKTKALVAACPSTGT